MNKSNLELLKELKQKIVSKGVNLEYALALQNLEHFLAQNLHLEAIANENVYDTSLETERNLRDNYLVRDSILRHNGYKSYEEFLNSEYWQSIREKVKGAKYKDKYSSCRICKTQSDIHLHHNNYRWLLTKYELREIISLCGKCHNMVHKIASEKDCTLSHALRYADDEIKKQSNLC